MIEVITFSQVQNNFSFIPLKYLKFAFIDTVVGKTKYIYSYTLESFTSFLLRITIINITIALVSEKKVKEDTMRYSCYYRL